MRQLAKVSALAGLLAGLWPAASQAQDSGFSPEQMSRQEGSLNKAGQLRETTGVDERAAPIVVPNPFEDRAVEKRVAVPAPAPPPPPRSVPSEVLALDTNMPARISEVLACRMEIATDRRVRVEKVAAGTVLLRWTIQPGGGVTGAETVALKKTDPDVLSCASRKMGSWVFIHGPGDEPLRIEQTVKFE